MTAEQLHNEAKIRQNREPETATSRMLTLTFDIIYHHGNQLGICLF